MRGSRELGAVLGELTAAGRPWLAIDMPGCAGRARSWPDGCDAAVIGLADPQVPPVMVNPFEPEPGFAVQAHARRLAELIEAVFGLASPAAEIIRAGLLRAYADCGWDAVTGAASPGASAPPAVPAFAQLRHAVLATAGDLGCDVSARAAIRGFVHARLEPMWTGPGGRFLEGGHPADLGDAAAGERRADRRRPGRRRGRSPSWPASCWPGWPSGCACSGGAVRVSPSWWRRPSAARRWPAGSPLRRGRYGRTAVMSSTPRRPSLPTPPGRPGRGAGSQYGTREPAGRAGRPPRSCSGADRRPAVPAARRSGRAAATNCTRPACSHATTNAPGSGSGP